MAALPPFSTALRGPPAAAGHTASRSVDKRCHERIMFLWRTQEIAAFTIETASGAGRACAMQRDNPAMRCEDRVDCVAAPSLALAIAKLVANESAEPAPVRSLEQAQPARTRRKTAVRKTCDPGFLADVEGAFAGGATQPIVNDAHWPTTNCQIEGLDLRARVSTALHKCRCMVVGALNAGAMFFPGQHACMGDSDGGGTDAILDREIVESRVNGHAAGGHVRNRRGRLRRARFADNLCLSR
ncbi:MAG: M55 family metallopeptidase [Thermomicrobiales bacterium]|nr:M55 family metallopeptidase [Thermomicrobiales bacterium]